jgi:hypothetical protein
MQNVPAAVLKTELVICGAVQITAAMGKAMARTSHVAATGSRCLLSA